VIVGGGPAGMEAARIAALRGHRPMIFDKNSRLGGLMILGSILDPEVEKVLKYQTAQIKKLGVKVRLETEANLDLILNENPDVVIVAGGGIAPPAGFPGEDGKNVFTLRDARAFLLGRSLKKRGGFLGPLGLKYFYRPSLIRSLMRLNYPFGPRVVIIGGKFGGFEFADILAQKGKVVTILEKSDRLGSDIGPATRFVTMGRMKKFGVRMETNVTVLEIKRKSVQAAIVTKDGVNKSMEIEADSVIVTVDLKANEELAQQLKGRVPFVYLVGDATERRPISPPNMWGPLQPRRIGEAIKAGYQSAIEL
jgi:NADPH-dependent 2,4-dienoyl-CoA reductase/sulfur reductase-like enzyme